ncbi:MAG: nucleotidyl transferase AbiEii/AbiGii toxin family protein [Thermodesulfobacteriota bacterium]
MDIFQKHELFEIEVLDRLHRAKLLQPLIFGGGTMLRLCHDLPRYSVDLDFWFSKKVQEDTFFSGLRQNLEKDYEITDARMKHYTMLLELRSASYPRRLKIEIRRKVVQWDTQDKIAFSRFSTHQVGVRALTLEQAMHNKLSAFLDRGEIRDCFDIEFLLRRGVALPAMDLDTIQRLQKRIQKFKTVDYRVKLGSIVEENMRSYYISQKFSYLLEKLQSAVR